MGKFTKLGLVVLLEIVLFAPHFLGKTNLDRGNKTIEEYWAETDLSDEELNSLLDSKICFNDKFSYLACANSVMQAAEKMGYVIGLDGKIRELSRADIGIRLTEKSALQPWADQWEQKPGASLLSFREIWNRLQQINTDASRKTLLIATAMNGYLSIAKDPHSYIIPLAYYEEVIARSDPHQTSMGFIIRRAKDHALVRKVFEASPAAIAGLRKGDRILRINGVEVSAMLPNVFAESLKTKDGDRLALLVERWDHEKRSEKYFELIRTEYTTPSVSSQLMEGARRLGLLTLNKFARGTCEQAKEQSVHLIEQGIDGLLLDLRDNPGGQVEEAACILNMFLPKGKALFATHYLDSQRPSDSYTSETQPIYLGPLAVLINSGSASASEIVAGTLKDLGRATLVGERSFGKGTFQDGRLWGSHGKIAVFETQGMYYFPSGWTPQVVGIEPDIQVEFADISGHRESELFFNPILPRDLWAGPQSLTWLQMMQCPEDNTIWQDFSEHFGDDTQLLKAREWLFCNRQAGVTQ